MRDRVLYPTAVRCGMAFVAVFIIGISTVPTAAPAQAGRYCWLRNYEDNGPGEEAGDKNCIDNHDVGHPRHLHRGQ